MLRLLVLIALSYQLAAGQQAANSPLDGAAIFQEHCARCHGDKGQGVNAAITFAGPSIQAVHEPGDAMLAMEAGLGHMPSFAYILSIEQMRAVADYVTQNLAVIPLTGGDLAEGGHVFRMYCAPCHRTAVRGGALAYDGINAPSLVGVPRAIVAGAIRMGPGPMPAFPSSVLDDKQLNSVVDYVTFAQHPPNPGGTPMNWYGPVAEGFIAWMVIIIVVFTTGWIEKGGRG